MNILFAVQGRYGERIAANVRDNGPREWDTAVLSLPRCLPPVIDDPADVLPAAIAPADLLVSLHESAGAADLIPDIAGACGARAVLAAVDDRAACPAGLENQVRRRLGALGIACAFPRPLCGFDGGAHPLLAAFAGAFGRPRFAIARDGDRIASVAVVRDAPCGSARFVASILPGTRVAEAPDTGALRHHHHPCLASMEIDPDLRDTLMHLSGYIVRAAIGSALKTR